MGSSTYHQTKHKRIVGMVDTVRASKCFSCGGLAPSSDIYKGWCSACLAAWGATANPLALESSRVAYAAARVAPEPPTAKAFERLKGRIAERRPDEWFLPMTLYVGNVTVGQLQANWNFLQAMYELEVMTTAHAFKLGRESHDTLHLCGRHAPMQNSSLGSFIGRVKNTPEVWNDIDPRMREYIQDFIAQQSGNFWVFTTARRRISRYAEPGEKTRRAWRKDPNQKTRREIRTAEQEWKRKYMAPVTPTPNFWPFAVRQAPDEHEMLMAIDKATRGIPEQWRQDVCQDLVVAVLSGETTLGNLKDAIPKHVSEVFKMHPIKYGNVSLDAPVYWSEGSRTLGDVLALVEQEDCEEQPGTDAAPDVCGWHAGRNRPVGLASLAEVAFSGKG